MTHILITLTSTFVCVIRRFFSAIFYNSSRKRQSGGEKWDASVNAWLILQLNISAYENVKHVPIAAQELNDMTLVDSNGKSHS